MLFGNRRRGSGRTYIIAPNEFGFNKNLSFFSEHGMTECPVLLNRVNFE